MLHPNWWSILKSRRKKEEEDRIREQEEIEDGWEEYGLGGLRPHSRTEEGGFYGEGVEQSEEQESRRKDEDDPHGTRAALLPDAAVDLLESTRGYVPTTYNEDEISAESEYFERLAYATRTGGAQTIIHDLLTSAFILGSRFDDTYMDLGSGEEGDEGEEGDKGDKVPFSHRTPLLLPRMMGVGPRIKSKHEIGVRPRVRSIDPERSLYHLLRLRNMTHELNTETNTYEKMDKSKEFRGGRLGKTS